MSRFRPSGLRVAVLLLALVSLPSAILGQDLGEARAAAHTGRYDDALDAYRRALRADASSVEARRGLVDVLSTLGRYDEAEAEAERASDSVALANTLGKVLQARGKDGEAEAAFRRAVTGGASDRLTAQVNLAELMLSRGRVDEAMAGFDRFIDIYNNSDGTLSARDLVAVGRAVHHLAVRNPTLFQDALRAFDEAAAADPDWLEPTVRAGDLFLEKYESSEAQAEFAEVLKVNPHHPAALLGVARALEFDGTGGAAERVAAALEVNPNSVAAHTLLARLSVTRGAYADARREVAAALEVNPTSLEALSVRAAIEVLAGDSVAFRRTRGRVLALDPHFADLDATVSELAVQVRRYEEAAERARIATSLDSTAWNAWGLLGMNELRLGRMDEGRRHLEIAFRGDPYNPWFKNSLDLLDTFDRYDVRRTEHFALFLRRDEADVLEPYVAEVAEEAYDSLARRYGAEPPTPVRVEMYPSHADFSVRTLGETGLGALGVTFGSVVVLDSPAARERGEYNWASTLWHEMAHAFHLAMTDHRVPRWFSEGLAVHEQHRASPGWGPGPTIGFVEALRDGRLKKVSELDDGFMRPEYPQQVIYSYYEASLVFEVIEDRYGFVAIRSMLDGYRRGETTEALFQSLLGTSLDRFDRDFDAYLHERFERPLAGLAEVADAPAPGAPTSVLRQFVTSHPGDLLGRLRLGAALVREGHDEEAQPHLRAALRMFPDYGGPDSPYWFLARIHGNTGDTARAAAALARLNGLSDSNYRALLEEADLEEALGRTADEARTLSRVMQVDPYEMTLHRRLASLLAEEGDHAGAVRERRAVVALHPPDRAAALYELARALLAAGDREGARHTVLQALEIAPEYEAALELLLRLRDGAGGGGLR